MTVVRQAQLDASGGGVVSALAAGAAVTEDARKFNVEH
jgi:hypothetical protein